MEKAEVRSLPSLGSCCLAMGTSAELWQVPTMSPLRGVKLGVTAERPSSCAGIAFHSLPFSHNISGI